MWEALAPQIPKRQCKGCGNNGSGQFFSYYIDKIQCLHFMPVGFFVHSTILELSSLSKGVTSYFSPNLNFKRISFACSKM